MVPQGAQQYKQTPAVSHKRVTGLLVRLRSLLTVTSVSVQHMRI